MYNFTAELYPSFLFFYLSALSLLKKMFALKQESQTQISRGSFKYLEGPGGYYHLRDNRKWWLLW